MNKTMLELENHVRGMNSPSILAENGRVGLIIQGGGCTPERRTPETSLQARKQATKPCAFLSEFKAVINIMYLMLSWFWGGNLPVFFFVTPARQVN